MKKKKTRHNKKKTKYKTKSMKLYNISKFYHTGIWDEIDWLIDWLINQIYIWEGEGGVVIING
jgi:hypothetical protein